MRILIAILSAVVMAAGNPSPRGNLVALHKNARANASACAGCHRDVLKQKSSNPKIKAFHPLHLESPLLKLKCVDCHQSVDLREASGATLRKQVDPKFCKSCHGPWPSGMSESFKTMDCTKCHADWKAKMAKAAYVNLGKVTAKDCLGCHGGRALYVGTQEKRG